MKKSILIGLIALSVLSSCNTLKGVGDDLKEAGHRLEKATD